VKCPKPKKVQHLMKTHDHVRNDEYYWMRNLEDDKDVLSHLSSENTYTDHYLSDTKKLQEDLYKELRARKKEEDQTVPALDNGYYYYDRYEKGQEYAIHCRKKSLAGEEEVLLNVNELAIDKEFMDVGTYSISPDGNLMAYAVDDEGSEIYKIYIKDLKTDSLKEEVLESAYSSISWFNDSEHFCYNVLNEQLRPYEVRVHKLGTTQEKDRVIYTENNGEYFVYCMKSTDDKFIYTASAGAISSEYSYLSADDPKAAITLVEKRHEKFEYDVDHFEGDFYLLTNDKHENFRVVKTSVENCSSEYWQEVIPGSDDRYLLSYESFKDFALLTYREKGLKKFQIIFHATNETKLIEFPQSAYSASEGENFEYNTSTFRFVYSSLNSPESVYDFDIYSGEKTCLKTQEVPGFNGVDYKVERLNLKGRDGELIPASILIKADTVLDGAAPLFVYGYGSYGSSVDPSFKDDFLSLVERGFNFAIIHPRGSSTLGRKWYENGKFLKKNNTFFDFIDATKELCRLGYGSIGNVAAMGGSAGGLLMGAITNLAPEVYKTIIAQVPFVDVLTTMLDKDLPLTQIEYKEWGNPEDKEYYDYILSYSPYDNLKEIKYPNILATAGLNDPRVTYWEPSKWISKIRDLNQSDSIVQLFTNMDAGHGGASGRFEYLKEEALTYAFILKTFELS